MIIWNIFTTVEDIYGDIAIQKYIFKLYFLGDPSTPTI